jgi:acetylornithine deacetylase
VLTWRSGWQAINPIELGFEALSEIQRRFYRDFPVHAQEARYGFVTPSTVKPTQISCK